MKSIISFSWSDSWRSVSTTISADPLRFTICLLIIWHQDVRARRTCRDGKHREYYLLVQEKEKVPHDVTRNFFWKVLIFILRRLRWRWSRHLFCRSRSSLGTTFRKDVDLSSVWLHEFKHVFVVHLLLCNDLSAHFFTFFFLFWSPVFRYHLRLAVCFSEFFFFDSSTLVSLSWSESASHFTPPETSLTIAARSFISQPPTSSSCPQRLLFSPHLSPSLVSFLR